eukprot:scaffold383182_cov15-Prasinocladus_malaysianus.AAC.2
MLMASDKLPDRRHLLDNVPHPFEGRVEVLQVKVKAMRCAWGVGDPWAFLHNHEDVASVRT